MSIQSRLNPVKQWRDYQDAKKGARNTIIGKCHTIGGGFTDKWDMLSCEEPAEQQPGKTTQSPYYQKPTICVTTQDMSHEEYHSEMDFGAKDDFKKECEKAKKAQEDLKNLGKSLA